MNVYTIQLLNQENNTPYITPILLSTEFWKKYISITAIEAGFIHIGDAMVLGKKENLLHFNLISHIPPEYQNYYKNCKIIITEKSQ